MLEIECAGERLGLMAEKAVYWPRTKTVIIADVHLGKPAAFRASGLAVPESTTTADLERLSNIIKATTCERLVILGDLFHARAGLQEEMLSTVAGWREAHAALELVLIPGNHDRHSGSPPLHWRVREVEKCWDCLPFTFCHEPQPMACRYELAGHLHPAIYLREKYGSGIRAPCFCFGTRGGILPAFGSFTGMINLQPKRGDRIFAISAQEGQVIEVTRSI